MLRRHVLSDCPSDEHPFKHIPATSHESEFDNGLIKALKLNHFSREGVPSQESGGSSKLNANVPTATAFQSSS